MHTQYVETKNIEEKVVLSRRMLQVCQQWLLLLSIKHNMNGIVFYF